MGGPNLPPGMKRPQPQTHPALAELGQFLPCPPAPLSQAQKHLTGQGHRQADYLRRLLPRAALERHGRTCWGPLLLRTPPPPLLL